MAGRKYKRDSRGRFAGGGGGTSGGRGRAPGGRVMAATLARRGVRITGAASAGLVTAGTVTALTGGTGSSLAIVAGGLSAASTARRLKAAGW